MWARVLEVAVGCWLLMSPFIFAHGAQPVEWWVTDFAGGSATIILAMMSFWPPLQRIHLLSLGVALWLISGAFLSGTPTPPAVQNQMTVGLLLAMLTIIPTDSNEPPESWRRRTEAKRRDDQLLSE
jgi:hypothetical protein